MRYPLLALLLAATAETAAFGCSCLRPPETEIERRRLARDAVHGASALVEVELARPYDRRSGRGERLRVRRTLAGRAPPLVEIERSGPPQSPACDLEFQPGRRTVVLLYPSRRRPGLHGVASSCIALLLTDPPFLRAAIAAMRRP